MPLLSHRLEGCPVPPAAQDPLRAAPNRGRAGQDRRRAGEGDARADWGHEVHQVDARERIAQGQGAGTDQEVHGPG